MEISVIQTKTVPTIKIDYNNKSTIFHSKYDPLREVKAWCDNAYSALLYTPYITVVGIGAGYHVKMLAESMPQKHISVIEFNEQYYNWFINSSFFERIKGINNLNINLFSNLSPENQKVIFSSVQSSNLLIHKCGLDIMPAKYNKLKDILEDIQFKKDSIKSQIGNMDRNFSENIKLNSMGIRKFKDKYKDRPFLLISAGPSLDKQIPFLEKIYHEKKIIIGAVGTALKPLVKNNIIPDFFSVIDPNSGTYEQISGLSLPNTTLFYLSTAFHETVKVHKGPKHILWQKGYPKAESMAVKLGDPLIQTGGSVATALLDLMVFLGAKKIALVGQDLAFTHGLSHANYSHAQRSVDESTSLYETTNYHQNGKVATAKNLTIYRKWFEDYALSNKEIELFNCTEGGAYINNWKHISLEDFHNSIK